MIKQKNRAFLGGKDWSPRDTFVRTFVSKDEIETALDSAVSGIASQANQGKQLAPGWHLMSAIGVDFIEIGEAKFPHLDEARAAKLVDLACKNCHAFDLAQHIAGMQIVALKVTGVDTCPVLTTFGAKILNGEAKRPRQYGRPLGNDALLKLWQYLLCKFIVATTTVRLTRNDATDDGFSACDAVADAFTRANRYTTYSQVKSVCFDKGAKEIRELADYIGLIDPFEPPSPVS
ncbi:hypothetical protein [Marivita sp. GX14005]|uniref:hypothetical protein n=1 Tax=Marivita sp. GX14005 TaxID=2942276 RepID=UPI002019888B|nr:hypothetical protein [Marivita sp. GX14005]MCL3880770.1 hypothetical protein [Marivita sp. GX14005]